jgi:DNA-binding beta-propeller fold protein YncE
VLRDLVDRTRIGAAGHSNGAITTYGLVANTKLRDIATGGKPEGIAVAGGKVFVGDLTAPRLSVFDAATYEKLGELAIDGNAIRVIASPDGKAVATSNVNKGSVTLIDAASHSVLRSFPVSGDSTAAQVTLIWSSDGTRLYAAETMRNQIAEIDAGTGKVLRRIDVGKNGDGLAVTRLP